MPTITTAEFRYEKKSIQLMRKHATTMWVLMFLMSTITYGQRTQFIDSGSVQSQFDYLIQKSNRYEDYKVVKINWLQQLQNNVADSLNTYRNELNDRHTTISAQMLTIDSLNASLNQSAATIDELKDQNSEIRVLGMDFKKSVFTSFTFVAIGILTLLLIVFITRFRSSNAITKQTKASLRELDEEFNEHRKIALEREQKVRRLLQDELNKQKNNESN
jgi:low affinity Fe/Cu permease